MFVIVLMVLSSLLAYKCQIAIYIEVRDPSVLINESYPCMQGIKQWNVCDCSHGLELLPSIQVSNRYLRRSWGPARYLLMKATTACKASNIAGSHNLLL
jgi:hypothetical protein